MNSDSEKKVGQGWGHEEGNAELKDETAGETDAKAEAGAPAEGAWGAETTADWGAPATDAAAAGDAAADDKAEGRPRREVEEEDNTLTLEEYLKQKKDLELVPKLETRKANEGDDSIWKDAIPVTKKDEEEDAYFVGKVGSELYVLISAHTNYRINSPSLRLRLAPRRMRRSSLRSMLASSAPSVAAVVVAAVTGATGPLAVSEAVVAEVVVQTATLAAPPSTSMTRRLSPLWLKEHLQHPS